MERAAASVGALATVPTWSAWPERGNSIAFAGNRHPDCCPYHQRCGPFTGTSSPELRKPRVSGSRNRTAIQASGRGRRIICALANFEPTSLSVDGLSALSTRGVTLELDVPRAPYGALPSSDSPRRCLPGAEGAYRRRQPRTVGPPHSTRSGTAQGGARQHGGARHRAGGALALRLFS